MTYFQNPSDSEFRGNLSIDDRQYSMTFKIDGASPNSSQYLHAWNQEPYNVSVDTNLTINYSFNSGMSWTALTINVSTLAANPAAALASEIAAALNANATFQTLFTAAVQPNRGVGAGWYANVNYVLITTLQPRETFKAYITNGNAESILRFNKKCGVREIPSYFARHTIANKYLYPDSLGMLVQLDPTMTEGQQIISEAGLSYNISVTNSSENVTVQNTNLFAVGDSIVIFDGTNTQSVTISTIGSSVAMTISSNWTGPTEQASMIDVRADYQLFRGRSQKFNFQNITVDGSDRITQIIEYPAGALPGDFARKIQYIYSGANTNPSQITEVPYTLTISDLVVP
jgi:hypothetical protein